MAWSMRPGFREDIVFEGRLDLNGSGAYNDDTVWLETPSGKNVRVSVRFGDYSGSPGFVVYEGVHVPGQDSGGGPFEVRTQSLTLTNGRGYAELELSARYFRLTASGGGASNVVYVTVRSVN